MEQTVEIKQKIITKPSRSGLKYHLKTFGCQMNEHDSERIAGLFEQDGMVRSIDEDSADVLLLILVLLGKMPMISYTVLLVS